MQLLERSFGPAEGFKRKCALWVLAVIFGSLTSGYRQTRATLLFTEGVEEANGIIYVDGVRYRTLEAATEACSWTRCVVDASNPLLGTQTLTANPFTGVNPPAAIIFGSYTVQYDPVAFVIAVPSDTRLIFHDTVLKSTRTDGAGGGGLLTSAVYNVTGTISRGSKSLMVSDASKAQVGSVVAVFGAIGGLSGQGQFGNQSTLTTSSMDLRDSSLNVASTIGFGSFGSTMDEYLLIDKEIVSYAEGNATSFTAVRRGLFGTREATHAKGARVYALGALVTEVKKMSGNTLTLADEATFSVTNATVQIGSTNISIEGNPTFDGNYTDTSQVVPSPVYGVYGFLASHLSTSAACKFQSFPHVGVLINAGWKNNIYGQFRRIGRPNALLGFDVILYQQSKYNYVKTTYHEAGNYMFATDDRSTNTTIYSGPSAYNVADIGPTIGTTQYVEGIDIEGGGADNKVTVGSISTSGAAIQITSSGQWTVDPPAAGNAVYFDEVEGHGGQAFAITGKATGNLIFGGRRRSGSIVDISSGNYVSFLDPKKEGRQVIGKPISVRASIK